MMLDPYFLLLIKSYYQEKKEYLAARQFVGQICVNI